ncbi:DMT family transporter [Bacteriovoracaceae bacterium]|nr:DMT family transporter [Bacteriovoracaceae bacterium]
MKLYLLLVLIQVLFGVNFSASKLILFKLDPFMWSNIRFLSAGLILGAFSFILRRPHPKLDRHFWLPLIPLSLLGMGLGQSLFLFGLKQTTSVNTAVISTFIPLLTVLIVILRGQEKMNVTKFLGIFISFIGVVGLRKIEDFSLSSATMMGDLFVLGGCLSFAIYLVFAKKFIVRYDNLWTTSYMFIVSGLFFLAFNFNRLHLLNGIEFTQIELGCMIYSIIGATVLTYFLNNIALSKLESSNVSLFVYIQPIIAFFFGWYFLGEKVDLRILVCSVLIFQGIYLSNLKIFKSN